MRRMLMGVFLLLGTVSHAAETPLEDHPFYQYLVEKRDKEWYRRLYVGYHFDALQLEANAGNPSQMKSSKIIPALGFRVEFWAWRSWGIRVRWVKGLLTFIPKTDPENKFLKTLDFLTPELTYRYYFQSTGQMSYVQCGLGLHYYNFGLVVADTVPWVKSAYGPALSIERKLAFTKKFGLRGSVDVAALVASYPQQDHWVSKSGGIGVFFDFEVYYTVINDEGLETLISLVYSQSDYMYRTTAQYQTDFNRSQYVQTYRSLQLQFGARL